MVTKELTMKKGSGFESKPAAMFIQKASSYRSSIWIEKGERKANAKSLLGILSLGIGEGAKIVISVEGEDEEKAIVDLEVYINNMGSQEGV